MGSTSFDEYLRTKVFIKAFVKGPPGSGKTFVAAAASQLWKTLYIDVEGGLFSALSVVNRDNIEVRTIPGSEPSEFFDRLADAMTLAESRQFECVVLDSITEVAGRMEDDYASKSASGKLDFGDWYVLQDRIRRLCRRLKDLSCNTIMTSLTKPTGKEDAAAIFEPVLPGQSAAVIPSFFDTVGLMRKVSEKREISYVFTTGGPSIYQVRDRYRALAPEERVNESEASVVWRKLQDGVHALSGSSTSKAPAKG